MKSLMFLIYIMNLINFTSKLFFYWCTDGPPIVSTDKNNRGVHHCCKIHASMKISLQLMMQSVNSNKHGGVPFWY